MLRVAINGFGRIGRTFLRTVLCDPQAHKKLQIVAINTGPADTKLIAHLFQYDTIMGKLAASVSLIGDELVIDNIRIRLIAEKDPRKLAWKELQIDWVVDASGRFTHRQDADQHIQAGARNVLITAPAHDEDVAIIPGVNDAAFDAARHHIVSLGSCTTNALLPTLHVMDQTFTIKQGCMTTVHAYTNTQVLLDVEGEDARRSRAAALNIIPTGTGASKMVEKVLPHLADRIASHSLRVPVAIVSLIDLTFTSEKKVTPEAINQACLDAQQGKLRGIMDVTAEPLVSSDFIGNPHSVIIDSQLTTISGPHMGKVFGWYDNEWGYSMRLKDFLVSIV
jgi:glyceraldehyde 3-phosphate dehydrogenase